jgi:hypothetical protein
MASGVLESQKSIYWLRIDRANQRVGLRGPNRQRIPFLVERRDADGKVAFERMDWLPVRTKAVRFVSPEGPVIPDDPYGRYCEIPPADGRDGRWYKVGPIEEVPSGSMDFGFYKIRLTGPPADLHGRSGLLIHGGGKDLPNPLADYQGWQCTHGCVRMQNAHLKALVQTLRDLPPGAEVRLIVDAGKCKLNGLTAETYRWDPKSETWVMTSP